MIRKKIIFYFMLANVCVLSSTFMLLLVPICNTDGRGVVKFFSLMVALIFWLGFIMAQIFYRKSVKWIKKYERRKYKKGGLPMFVFAGNKYAKIVDISMLIAFVMLVIILLADVDNQWIIIFDVGLLYMTVNFHYFYNGPIERYILCQKGEDE